MLIDLLAVGALAVIYWVFRVLGFIIRAPFRAIGRVRHRGSRVH